jgi:hypothetical protein
MLGNGFLKGGEMSNDTGKEYFWICERAMQDFRWLSETEQEEVLAEAVYLCFTLPYPLTYALAKWAVRFAVRKHCSKPLLSLNRLSPKFWKVYPTDPPENNVVDLEKYRKSKNVSHSQMFSRH